jgi:hypothetical protein
MATDENPQPEPDAPSPAAAAPAGDAKYPAAVQAQHGWLPGIGHDGVVLEWSHAVPDTQKLEVMLSNAISILDTMTTLSTATAGIQALHTRVRFISIVCSVGWISSLPE